MSRKIYSFAPGLTAEDVEECFALVRKKEYLTAEVEEKSADVKALLRYLM